MSLERLGRLALLGLREAPAAEHDASPIGAWLAAMNVEPAAKTLRAAAAWRLAERAGQVAARPDLVAAPPCPDEPRVALSLRAAQALRRVLEGYQPTLLEPMLREIAAAGRRVPEAWLPAVLEQGRQASLRPAVVGVACHIARWLGAQNPDWAYVTGADDSERVFEEGAPLARRVAFR